MMQFRISDHALDEIERRQISRILLEGVLQAPEQIVPALGIRRAYQSRIETDTGRPMLLRAIVDESENPPVVITAYRTSKIDKYWSKP
jgi:hypothetical protein